MADWFDAAIVEFKQLRAAIAGTPREILPTITSSLIRILFNDNPEQTYMAFLYVPYDILTIFGFIGDLGRGAPRAIADDPPIPPEFTWERLRMNLEGLRPHYPEVEALFQNQPAVVDRALFVTWAKKVLLYTKNAFRGDFAASRPAFISLEAPGYAYQLVVREYGVPPPIAAPIRSGSSVGDDSSAGSSVGDVSGPPSAAGSPDPAAGDPVHAGGRRRRTRTQRVLRTRTRKVLRTRTRTRTRTRRIKKHTPR